MSVRRSRLFGKSLLQSALHSEGLDCFARELDFARLTYIDAKLDLVAKTARLGGRVAINLKVGRRPHDVTEPGKKKRLEGRNAYSLDD